MTLGAAPYVTSLRSNPRPCLTLDGLSNPPSNHPQESAGPGEKPGPAQSSGTRSDLAMRRPVTAEIPSTALPDAAATGMEPGAELPRVLTALRNRDFRYMWAGNFLSTI